MDSFTIAQLAFIRNGGETRRYHTEPVLRQQTVAEHSFHVAMLVSLLCGAELPGIRANVLLAALTHDLAEHVMGDLPAPSKRSLPAYTSGSFREVWGAREEALLADHGLEYESSLTPQELRYLKLADALEGCFYCIRERMMGNKIIDAVFHNFRSYVLEIHEAHDEPSEVEKALVTTLLVDWERANG